MGQGVTRGYSVVDVDSSSGNAGVSVLSSSTTPLNNGENFTGEWISVGGFPSVVVAVKTDQDGYYEVQYSTDKTNVDTTLTTYFKTALINAPHRYTNTRSYFRIKFVNDSGSNQTYFRLQVLIGDKSNLSIPLHRKVSRDYDSISVRPTNFEDEVASGFREGITKWNKFAHNDDLDTADGEQTIWSVKETLVPLTTADTLDIVSSDAADDTGGTGAITLTIYGIDANRLSQVVTYTLDGVTPVTTAETWLGVNRAVIASAGTGLVNAGVITITGTTLGNTQAAIEAGAGVTEQSFFFTQASHISQAKWLNINVNKVGGSSPKVTIRGYLRDFTAGTRIRVFQNTIDSSVVNDVNLNPSEPFTFPQNSLIEFTASTDTNNTIVHLRFDLKEYTMNIN